MAEQYQVPRENEHPARSLAQPDDDEGEKKVGPSYSEIMEEKISSM